MTYIAALAKGDEFEAVAANAGIGLRVRTMPTLAKTVQRMLTRILRNLLSNASRYTRSGVFCWLCGPCCRQTETMTKPVVGRFIV